MDDIPSDFLASGRLDSAVGRLLGDPVGRQLGAYQVTGLLGAGGMGEVYRARDTKLGREVAIKVLPSEVANDRTWRERLLREARAAASLNHPNICTVHEVGEADGQIYIAMELVEGQLLSERLEDGPLPKADIVRYGLQLAEALRHAHERGVVHRDFKSGNVAITPEGRAKVLDFGLAKRLIAQDVGDSTTGSAAGLTQTGTLAGTLPYMAPEQLRGQPADSRSDVWALGVVLYEMAAGARPFRGRTDFELSSAILSQAPPPLKGWALNGLVAVIERCLEKEPARRYSGAGEVQTSLEAIGVTGPAGVFSWFDRGRRLAPAMLLAAVLALVAAAVVYRVRGQEERQVTGTTPIDALAVLPLANLMGGADQEYYVAAMHDALIAELGQVSALSVISRTSVMRYRNTDKSMPDIARELNVDALVEGSVFKAGNQVRIQVQLIRPSPVERQLWSRVYEGDAADVMGLQKTAARGIAEQIRVSMTPQEVARFERRRAVDPNAYDAWAKGSFQFNTLTGEGLQKCIEYAQASLAIDSNYAPAYALMAACQGTLPNLGLTASHDGFPKAAAAASRALELDDSLADARFALAWTLACYDWNWAAAEREFRHGLDLNPSSAFGHARFGWFLSWIGRFDQALSEVNRAVSLDPVSPQANQNASVVHLMARRYDEAIRIGRRTTAIAPNYSFGYGRLGWAYVEKGMLAEAIDVLERAVQLSGNAGHKGALGRAYVLSGRRDDARRILNELLDGNAGGHRQPLQIAMIYTALGNHDEALRWLEEGYRMRDANLVVLKSHPSFDPLRSNRRFEDLVRRMKFPS